MRYKGGNNEKQQLKLKQISKNRQSSDCRLKLAYMKSESLVIVNHHVTVNDLSNFAHTAHHARRVVLAGHYLFSSRYARTVYTLSIYFLLKVYLSDFKSLIATAYIVMYTHKRLISLGVKDSAVIWAKLKQGNGRGTCCWSTHI